MKTSLFKCSLCNKYTMKTKCSSCDSTTAPCFPPRFSPEDRWGKYRRLLLNNIGE
ncbi:MAG: nucleolar RNA-binding Nop10p family protein [Candidatus Thermoplasmatota archaeon]|nr:nucleolar RNA-binding Nop10p family protein [Candidatus Thermoplasmatota archaeon]MDP7265842.1 nucleolar RNA-binding Nop10p family protein [Candidatus Thermoplasmatota archaeon]